MPRDNALQLRQLLRELHMKVGTPNARGLGRTGRVADATAQDVLTGSALPRWSTVQAFVEACEAHHKARSRHERDASGLAPLDFDLLEWRRRHAEAAASAIKQQPDPAQLDNALGWPLAQLPGPSALEVHPAIAVPGQPTELPELTLYVQRAHDDRLRDVTYAARHESQLLVLVGGSANGKTRACYEALRLLPRDWRLWHPLTPTRPKALLAGLRGEIGLIRPGTVVWLNEIQDFLAISEPHLGEAVARELLQLLRDTTRSPVLILGTLWPQYWNLLTDPSSRRDTSALLTERVVRVEEGFRGYKKATSVAAGEDPRWHLALTRAVDRPTQFLSGGVALLANYRSATPVEAAVLHAAVDARRTGHPRSLRSDFLGLAATGYLEDADWAQIARGEQREWASEAIARLSLPRWGASGALSPVRGQERVVELNDYLEHRLLRERVTTQPSAQLWRAALAARLEPDVLRLMAHGAELRGRFRHASALRDAAAQKGYVAALLDQAYSYGRTGRRKDRLKILAEAVQAGSLEALREICWDLMDTEGLLKLEALSRSAKSPAVLGAFGLVLEVAGELKRAIAVWKEAAEAGDELAWQSLARARREVVGPTKTAATGAARQDAALRLLSRLGTDRANATTIRKDWWSIEWPMVQQTLLYDSSGDTERAEALAQQSAAEGYPGPALELVSRRLQSLAVPSAHHLAREAAAAGDTDGLMRVAAFIGVTGEREYAVALYKEALAAGAPLALAKLAALWDRYRDPRAELLRRFGVDDDGEPAFNLPDDSQ